MFRHRPRRSTPFSDFINWTDYRWEPAPWRGVGRGPRAWSHHAPHQRGYTILQVFLAGLAVVVGLKLMASMRNIGNRSWPERAGLAVLLLIVASYVSKRRQRL